MLTGAQPSFWGSGSARRAVTSLQINRVGFIGTACDVEQLQLRSVGESGGGSNQSCRSDLMKHDVATS